MVLGRILQAISCGGYNTDSASTLSLGQEKADNHSCMFVELEKVRLWRLQWNIEWELLQKQSVKDKISWSVKDVDLSPISRLW